MLAGATGIDFVLLVVAADDGVDAADARASAIVDLLGIDARHRRADQGRSRRRPTGAPRSTPRSQALLAGTGLAGVGDRAGLGRDRRGHRRAARALIAAAESVRTRVRRTGAFRLAVDRSLHARRRRHGRHRHRALGRGRGRRPGHRQPVGSRGARALDPCAEPPGRARRGGRALRAQSRRRRRSRKDAIQRGDVVLDPAPARADRPHRRDACACCLRAEADRPMDAGALHHAAAEVGGPRRRAAGDEPIRPGRGGVRPARAGAADRGRCRRPLRHARHLGEPHDRRRVPSRSARARAQAAHAGAAARDRRACERDAADGAGAARWPRRPTGSISPRSCATAPSAPALAGAFARAELSLVRAGDQRPVACAMLPASWDRLHAQALATPRRLPRRAPGPAGHRLEQLRLRRTSRAAARRSFWRRCRKLAEAGDVALDGAWVRRPGHEVRFSAEDERIWARIRPLLADASASGRRACAISPTPCSVDEAFVRRLMRLAARRGDVDEIAHDHFFLRIGGRRDGRDRHRRRRPLRRRQVHGRAVPRPARQRAQGGDPDPRILRSPWLHASAAATCAASIRRASSCFAPQGGARQQTEESRSRWGDRTSNPGGAVRRSQVGSTPILLRHPPARPAPLAAEAY